MLKIEIKAPETISEEVQLTVPGQDEPGKFTAIFKYRNAGEYREFLQSVEGKENIEVLLDILAGWQDVDLEFSPDNVAKLIKNYPISPHEIMTAYGQALFRSKVKN